jgi:hypothetical protein
MIPPNTPLTDDSVALSNLLFNDFDVLFTDREKILRRASLIKATTMESISSAEVVLTVEDQSCCRKIRSRILLTGDDRVVLGNGVSIPIRSIHAVEFLA